MAVDSSTLARWRSLDAAHRLGAVAECAKRDFIFKARSNPHTSR
ncbi:MAG TPA: hypothetical protein PK880_15060 [Candidatus Competibacter sp.]|nr:hypothetical protein [Candidatus Competibacter sp.]